MAAGPGRGQLSIATYNVENLSPSDPPSKFAALGQGVVHNLASPDIVALEEVQDNTGPTDDGTVAADQTLTELTQAITAAGGPSYQWREIDPVNDQDGGQPGGNIRVAFLFNPDRVSFVDTGASSVNRSTTGTSVVKSRHRAPRSRSRRGASTRPTRSGRTAASRWSASSSSRARTSSWWPTTSTRSWATRTRTGATSTPSVPPSCSGPGQAGAVHNFVQSILAVQKDAQVVVVGDLNDYQFSPAVNVLKTGTADGSGTPILTDLITTLPTDQQYTYVYDGISQVLDHILVSPKVAACGTRWSTSTPSTPTRPATTILKSSTSNPEVVRSARSGRAGASSPRGRSERPRPHGSADQPRGNRT